MAPRIEVIGEGSLRDIFDILARRLAGETIRQPSVEDMLADIFSPPTLDDRFEMIDDAIVTLQRSGALKYLSPVTARSRIQLSDNAVFIGPEGFPEDHQHLNFVVRHPKPEKRDRWRLWSICPGHTRARPFHIKNVEDISEAERVANIILDIGLGLVGEEPYLEALLKAKRERPAETPQAEAAPVASKE